MDDLAQRLGVELPIIQAPMAGVQLSALAIAVCDAGGLGSLPCAMLDAAAIRREIATIRGWFARRLPRGWFPARAMIECARNSLITFASR